MDPSDAWGDLSYLMFMKPKVKTVGRVSPERHRPAEAIALQDAVATMYRERVICVRGVFRFSSFQEADDWLMKQMVDQALERRRRQTSPGSREVSTSTGSDTP
jgi:hypothetical protein